MSLLSQEQQDRLVAHLTGAEELDPPQELDAEEMAEEYEEPEGDEEELEAEEYEEGEHDEPEHEEEEAYEADSDEQDEEEEVAEGHRVPYERFRKVNQHRRDLEARLQARELELEQLRQSYNRRQEPQARREYENHHEELESDVSWDAPSDPSSGAIQELQVKVAQMELEQEISTALAAYPEVPEEFLWESIAQNGTQQAMDLAAGYSSFVAEVEEAAVARYLAAMEEEEQQIAQNSPAPPRVARRRTVQHTEPDEDYKLTTLDQAKDAMVAYLKDI